MKKEKYEPIELAIIHFCTNDVIMTSLDYEDDETLLIPNPN